MIRLQMVRGLHISAPMGDKLASRGDHLLRADRWFASGGDVFARLLAPMFKRLLDRVDAGLMHGGIDATLPNGIRRRLGFRAPGPVAVVQLNSWMALVRLGTSGSVGWYRAWDLGEWSSPDPVPLFDLFMRNAEGLGDVGRAKGLWRIAVRAAHTLRANTKIGARRNIAAHYDLGNDFYAPWLDRTMTYSSAVFADLGSAGTEALEDAQLRKIRLLLDRLKLKPGQRLLEIGCGWASLAEIAARDYGVSVVGLTLSEEQKALAEQRIAGAGLQDQVEIRLQDYRDIDGQFDAVVSVEMVEAVGQSYWSQYLAAIAGALKPGGRAALQLISIRPDLFADYAASADFIQAYIFPGGMLISEPLLAEEARRQGLSWQDRAGFGLHYAETLRRWRERFDAAVQRGELDGFGAQFHDLWRYYLMYCEGGFRGGGIDVAQVTLTKEESSRA